MLELGFDLPVDIPEILDRACGDEAGEIDALRVGFFPDCFVDPGKLEELRQTRLLLRFRAGLRMKGTERIELIGIESLKR